MKHGGTCNCAGCQLNEFRAHHMGYKLARKVFILLLLVIAFWFGAKYGETKAFEYQIHSGESRMRQEQSGNVGQPMILNMQPTGTATPAAQ